jgi:Kef-type K+ transport system membrane component KefB
MWLAALLLVGYACGETAKRIALPRITGYLALGLLIGDTGTGWLDADAREGLRPVVEIGLALLLLELGQRLDLHWMRRERWLGVMAAGEMALTWLLSFTALKVFAFSHAEAAFLAAAVVSTSPVVVMYVAREEGADGQVSNRVLALAALNSLAAFALATLLLPWLQLDHDGNGTVDLVAMLVQPAWRLAGSVLLGAFAFGLHRFCARGYGKRPQAQFVLAIAMVLLTVGLADGLGLSVLCAMLTLGVLIKNADPHRRIRHIDFGFTSEVLSVVLFVVAGASARFSASSEILAAATLLVAVRFVAKMLPVFAIAPLTPLGLSRAGLVAIGLMPLSGFTALVLVDPAAAGFASNGRLVAVFLAAVAILELLGPSMVRFAFRRARETHAVDES